MSVFKEEMETKRVIFNVRMDLAERLEKAKEDARVIGKKLDLEGVIDKALEKFLKKAERKLEEKKVELGLVEQKKDAGDKADDGATALEAAAAQEKETKNNQA